MRGKLMATLATAVLIVAIAITPAGTAEAARNRDRQDGSSKELQEVSYNLTQLPENPRQYSLVISDADERSISGSFSIDQLQILRAIMVEAANFAMTGEAAGTKEPITTRFMDKQEPAFIVDVQKVGIQSLLFLTLKTEIGRLTLTAGKATRSTRREDGFFFGLLSRLESVLPKPDRPPKSVK
jgi:hypothetical protein